VFKHAARLMRSRQATGFLAVAALATTFVFLASGAASADANDPDTSTAVTLSTNVVAVGAPVTLTATVTGEGNPTGKVEFDANSGSGAAPIGTVNVTAVGGSSTDSQTSLTTSGLAAGTYTITATFKSSNVGNFSGSVSAGQSLIVTALPIHSTGITLTSSPANPVPFDQSVTFTATVAESDGGTMIPTGTVTFNDITTDPNNPVFLGSATLGASGTATISVGGFLSNPHIIRAAYLGDASDNASATTLNVQVSPESNQPTATATTVTASPSEITVGDSTTLSAQVSPAPPAGELVTFSANGSFAGQAPLNANGNATLVVGGWPAGSYDIRASYQGDSDTLASSGDTALTVDPGVDLATPTTTTLTIAPSPITAAQTTTFFAHVVQTDGTTLPPQGELVTFTAGGSLVGQVPLDVNGNASLMVGGWTEGTYDIQASYGGDTFDGPSSDDASLTVTSERTGPPPPLTVTGPSVPMTYGGAVPTLTPTYNGFVSGDTADSLSSPATCTTVATSTSPVGAYPVTCTGATDVNYAITYVDGTVTVNPAPLTVTAPPTSSMTYGGTAPTFPAPTYSGFLNGDTTTSLTSVATCTTAATSSSPVGSYPVTCSGAAGTNYTATYVAGNLVVNKAALTVTAPAAATMTFGGSAPALTPSTTGFVNGDTVASLSTPPACTTTATSSSVVGSYPVTCAGAAAANYTFTYVAGHLAVTPAVLTVTAPAAASMIYGATLPTLTPSYAGFLNGNTTASLASPATCTTTATRTSPVGSYPVTCSGAAGANYTITYVAGALTVNKAALTITAPSPTMILGAAVPTLTPTYSGFLNGDTAASLTAAPACTTTATSSSPLGSYPVTCSGATAANYVISYVAGNLTVTPAIRPSATVTSVKQGGVTVTSVARNSAVTDQATVSGTGASTPTGTVTFTLFTNGACSGSGSSGGPITLSSGVASSASSGSLTTAGSYSYRAAYSGDSNYAASTAACEPFTVTSAIFETVVYTGTTNATYSQSMTLSNTLTPAVTGANVTYSWPSGGGGSACSVGGPANGSVGYAPNWLGPKTVTVTYAGDSTHARSSTTATVTVSAPTVISVSGSPNSSRSGQSVAIHAHLTVNGTSFPAGTLVTFKDGSTTLGSATISGAGDATINVSSLSVGSHTITASYAGNSGSYILPSSATYTQKVTS
jgi:MBG domain (YGX type)/Bacterial Ig-like domain (group 3)